MNAEALDIAGLMFGFFGTVLMLIFGSRTIGLATPADQKHYGYHILFRLGVFLLALGFGIQLLSKLSL